MSDIVLAVTGDRSKRQVIERRQTVGCGNLPEFVLLVLICLVMAVSGVFAFSGAVSAEKFGGDVAWAKPYGGAESMKVINLMGDDQDELFIQNTSNISIYDGNGADVLCAVS